MSVGLPGSGIGGIFYLVSALWMPFDGAIRSVRRRRLPRLRLAARQGLLAFGIVAALYLTGVGLEHLVMSLQAHAASVGGVHAVTRSQAGIPRVFREASVLLTFGTLSMVLLSVQVLRMFATRPFAPSPDEVEKRKAA